MQVWAAAWVLFVVQPSMSTPAVPAAPRVVGGTARVRTPEILFINFDGAVLQSGCGNDAHYDCSSLSNLFNGYVGPFNGDESRRMQILQSTRSGVADFGVRVLVDRPPDDIDYTMVLYGILGDQDFAGIAPYIDCDDLNPGDTSFTQGFSSAPTGATVILQEAAHTWGLEHVDSELDIMNPFKSPTITMQRFVDECYRIVSNTELEPTAGNCNQIHTLFCEPGWQNSYEEMLYLFGPHIPDVTAPEVTITYPKEGDVFVLPSDLRLRGTIVDEQHPQPYEIEIFNHGESVFVTDKPVSGLEFDVKGARAGDYDLRVAVTDLEGNVGYDSVRFTMLAEGSVLPGEDDQSDDGVGCQIDPTRTPVAGLALLLLPLVRRRRS